MVMVVVWLGFVLGLVVVVVVVILVCCGGSVCRAGSGDIYLILSLRSASVSLLTATVKGVMAVSSLPPPSPSPHH